MASDRTQDPAAATANLAADDDDDFGEADEGGDANDNVAYVQTVLRMFVETHMHVVGRGSNCRCGCCQQTPTLEEVGGPRNSTRASLIQKLRY